MSYSISDLMIRNLRDVFGENDPARRRAAIDELWAEDGMFYDPNKGAIRGRDAIDRSALYVFRQAALSSSLPSEGHHLVLMRQRYGADVAILENRASALSCSSSGGNRNEAGG